jgi:hypothetical protein
MKPLLTAVLAVALAASLRAQAPAAADAGAGYTPEQLDQLVAPIALYPDPLVALILPAATVPSDLALAAQYLAAGGSAAGIDAQSWGPSVKGLAHYPEVVKWMNDNPDWTAALGGAFAAQPSEVMKSVQQMRARARAAGTLTDTAQQRVDMNGDDILILPTDQDTIYVPEYDSDVVYDVPEGYEGPFITFGVGYPVGAWLGFECDWDSFGIWFGPWRPGWAYRRDWRDSHWGGRQWRPEPRRGFEPSREHRPPSENPPSPRPIAGARGTARPVGAAQRPAGRPVAVQEPSRPDYRGYAPAKAASPSSPAPSGSLFGGYGRGTQARDYSARGQESRQAPVRSFSEPSRAEPARSAPAPSGGRDRR